VKVRLSVIRGWTDGGWTRYDAEIELPDKTPLETVEAHERTILRALDEQAHTCGEDDDE
jgi:hypothetical protein